METWTAAQLGEFLAGVEDDPLYAAYVLIATTGMRRGEAMGLRWQDVDLDACFVRIRQTLTTVNDQLVFDTTKTDKSRRRITTPAGRVRDGPAYQSSSDRRVLPASHPVAAL